MVTTTEAPMKAAADTEEKTASGWVRGFTVDDDRLLIKLDCSAIFRMLVAFPADAPNFRTAVSLTMLAYTNNERLSVRYTLPGRMQRPLVTQGIEIGLGEKAFEIADWNFKVDV